MGWMFSNHWSKKEDIISHCIGSWNDNAKVVNYSVRGNRLWVLVEHVKGDRSGWRFVCLFMLSKSSDGWGYKDISDSCAPCYYDCPISFIEQSINSGRELNSRLCDWHDKVYGFHKAQVEKRKKTASFKPKMKVLFEDKMYELIEKLRDRRGWTVLCFESGGQYRMSCKQAANADIVYP